MAIKGLTAGRDSEAKQVAQRGIAAAAATHYDRFAPAHRCGAATNCPERKAPTTADAAVGALAWRHAPLPARPPRDRPEADRRGGPPDPGDPKVAPGFSGSRYRFPRSGDIGPGVPVRPSRRATGPEDDPPLRAEGAAEE